MELYEEALNEEGKFKESEPIARQILKIRERLLDRMIRPQLVRWGLGGVAAAPRRQCGSRALYPGGSQTYSTERVGGPTRRFPLRQRARPDAAAARRLCGGEKLLEEALSRVKKRFGPDGFLTLFLQRVLVRALAEEGRLVEAEALGKETLDARIRTKADQDDVGTGAPYSTWVGCWWKRANWRRPARGCKRH